MDKREFLQKGTLGACGLFLGMNWIKPLTLFPFTPLGEEPDRWSKEALFYDKTPDGIKCRKCPNECLLQEGETGICRNRIVYEGKLYTIAYGNACAVHIDPIEKKPLFHFLPSARAFSIAAAGCNLRCLNCQNWQISQFSPRETINEDLMPAKVVEGCISEHCETIAYTYGEPTTFYEYAYDTAIIARKKGIRNIWKSNGYINEEPLRKLCRVLDAANIDLKGFDPDVYRKLNGAQLAPVLRSLKIFKEEGVWLEITNLVIPTWTDHLDVIRRMTDWLVANGLAESPLHFSRFVPQYKLTQLPLTPVSVLEQARDIAMKSGVKYVYIGNVPGHWAENTFCHECGKMIIERHGFAILRNDVVKGKCRFCGTNVPGVWS